jgi:D-alanyl-D-alanine carboxypeptidase
MQSANILIQTIDTLLQESYSSSEPGAAVIVVKNGKTILRKGQGMANLELEVPIEPDMVFRLGSITKQFTAIAILMLAEQGKLALDDSITKFLPDYPTHGHLITIEFLLTHTSGIKNYTDIPEWQPLLRKDFSVQELIDFFKYQPMQFAPRTQWEYSNSGYILLGAIIEKVSGATYEQFIQQNIFGPLGMKQSYYDCPLRVTPRRVAGYAKGSEGYTNAVYLSMTQPYAAGSLSSTVDDLAIWDAALYTEKLLKQETLRQAFIPYRLKGGSSISYGYGWGISEYEGHRLIEHGGGIPGFSTQAIRIPNARVFVAVLTNNEGISPELLAFKIATSAIGRPYLEPTPVKLAPEILVQYEGVYQISALEERHITYEDNRLFSQRGQNQRLELVSFSSNEFFFKDMPPSYLTFTTDAIGAVTTVEMRRRSGIPEIAKKTISPEPETP